MDWRALQAPATNGPVRYVRRRYAVEAAPPYGDENTVSRKPRPTDSDNYNPKPFGIVQRWRYEDAKNKDKNNK